VKRWKKVFQANGSHEQAGVTILISDKGDFRLKSIRRNNGVCFILIKGTILQEEILILKIYAPNTGALIYIKKKKTVMDLRAQINPNRLIVEDLDTPLSPMDRSSRQNTDKETAELLYTLDQIDISIDCFTKQRGNTHSSLQLGELSLK
jgi:hypothetical protein